MSDFCRSAQPDLAVKPRSGAAMKTGFYSCNWAPDSVWPSTWILNNDTFFILFVQNLVAVFHLSYGCICFRSEDMFILLKNMVTLVVEIKISLVICFTYCSLDLKQFVISNYGWYSWKYFVLTFFFFCFCFLSEIFVFVGLNNYLFSIQSQVTGYCIINPHLLHNCTWILLNYIFIFFSSATPQSQSSYLINIIINILYVHHYTLIIIL